MNKNASISLIVLRIYMGLFFCYMFLPLIVMVAAGVNNSTRRRQSQSGKASRCAGSLNFGKMPGCGRDW